MVDYAILRTAKLSHPGNIMGSLAHTFRERDTFNADSTRTPNNRILVGSDNAGGVYNTLNNRLGQLGKIRKNGVRCVELLQTYSPEAKVPLDQWIKANIEWNKRTFGEDNIISSVLHDDETTPHIVTYFVPEVNGRLNCREILGGRGKLRAMQTSYAKEMQQFGLERGKENSRARHRSIGDYYGDIIEVDKRVKKINKRQVNVLKNLPKPKTLETKGMYENRVKEQQKPVYDSYKNLTKTLANKELQIKRLEEKIEDQEFYITMYKNQAERFETMFNQLSAEDNLSKENIGYLRKLDVSMVAKKLNYMGEIKPKENAIDLTKRLCDFNYKQAVAWLYHEFGPEYVGSAIAEDMAIKKPERPFRKVELAIKHNMMKQLDALGNDKYRLTLQRDDNTFLPGKRYDREEDKEIEKFYTKQDLVNMIPYLLQRNTQENYNISITPMDDNCFYILLDDCRLTYNQLRQKGFKPCLYQKTSYNSYQAVFKVPNELDRDVVIKFCKSLNVKYGDKKMGGLRHPFRLVGFDNRKPKHERNNTYPRVELEHAVNTFCEQCIQLIMDAINRLLGLENDNNTPSM